MPDSLDGLGRKRKSHCKKGHPYDEANTYWHQNWKGYQCRGCRACVREAMQRRRDTDPEFNKRGAERQKRFRESAPEQYLAHVREARRKKKAWLDSLKVKCLFCAETHVACLEFHHRNPAEKDFLLSVGVAKFSLRRLQAEVAKCDVICSNCHRKHHWQERQNKTL